MFEVTVSYWISSQMTTNEMKAQLPKKEKHNNFNDIPVTTKESKNDDV